MKSFAKIADTLARKERNYQKKLEAAVNPAMRNSAQRMLDRIDERRQELMRTQENKKIQKTRKAFAKGGRMKYADGGPTDPPKGSLYAVRNLLPWEQPYGVGPNPYPVGTAQYYMYESAKPMPYNVVQPQTEHYPAVDSYTLPSIIPYGEPDTPQVSPAPMVRPLNVGALDATNPPGYTPTSDYNPGSVLRDPSPAPALNKSGLGGVTYMPGRDGPTLSADQPVQSLSPRDFLYQQQGLAGPTPSPAPRPGGGRGSPTPVNIDALKILAQNAGLNPSYLNTHLGRLLIQHTLADENLYNLKIDGIIGDGSMAGMGQRALARNPVAPMVPNSFAPGLNLPGVQVPASAPQAGPAYTFRGRAGQFLKSLDKDQLISAGTTAAAAIAPFLDNIATRRYQRTVEKPPAPTFTRPLYQDNRVNVDPQLIEARRSDKAVRMGARQGMTQAQTVQAVTGNSMARKLGAMNPVYAAKENQERMGRNRTAGMNHQINDRNRMTADQYRTMLNAFDTERKTIGRDNLSNVGADMMALINDMNRRKLEEDTLRAYAPLLNRFDLMDKRIIPQLPYLQQLFTRQA